MKVKRTVETADDEFFYGDEGTIHGNTELDIEVRDGKVVSVWFRCLMLPFRQVDVDDRRSHEMEDADVSSKIKGIVIERAKWKCVGDSEPCGPHSFLPRDESHSGCGYE